VNCEPKTFLICEGAQVEGNIIATELGISGRVKGTIPAVRVKLHITAVVEADIFHRSLAIEANSRSKERPAAKIISPISRKVVAARA
jgi:cytoskeletal protein CcmA (bactofilin family)